MSGHRKRILDESGEAMRIVPTTAEIVSLRDAITRLEGDNEHLRDALAALRDAWNAHMETCPQHAALPVLPGPTWQDLERWRNALSNTASGE